MISRLTPSRGCRSAVLLLVLCAAWGCSRKNRVDNSTALKAPTASKGSKAPASKQPTGGVGGTDGTDGGGGGGNLQQPNRPVSGSVTCTGAVPQAVGNAGSAFSVTCSGATDPDGPEDITYELVTVSGTCPALSAAGVITGTFGAAQECSYAVKACDEEGCTSVSPTYSIAGYALTASLGSPSLAPDCTLSVPGSVTASPNLSNLSYGGALGLTGAAASASGLSVSLSPALHAAGPYQASWGVVSGSLGSALASSAVFATATPVPFSLTLTPPQAYTQRVPSATIAGNVQAGRQVPAADPGAGKCLHRDAQGYAMVVAGAYHTCALTAAGAVKCWGENSYGQLGDSSTTQRNVPTDVSGLASGVAAIAAGGYHTCALTAAGAVKCWGYNVFGQLGDSTTTQRNVPTDVSGLTSGVTAIAAGEYHTCALTSVGDIKCWGGNDSGQLGDSTTTQRNVPTDVSNLASGATAIAAGSYHACALMSAGAVKCWGENSYGQLGDSSTTQRNVPTDVSGLISGVTAVATGGSHTCVVTSAGAVKCWGNNLGGQLGDGSTTQRNVPTDVSGLASGVTTIAASSSHTCALTGAGAARCWGHNVSGQLGDGSTTHSTVPTDVVGLTSGVSAISAGAQHTCALTGVGALKCWGLNIYSQLGNNIATIRNVPTDVTGLASGVTSIAVGGFHTCALTAGGAVKCSGRNSAGQLGDGSTTQRNMVTDVSGLSSGVTAIATGDLHTCALTSGGAVKCWGSNGAGQLGDNSTTNRSVPIDVSMLTSGVSAIVAGAQHTCALTSGGAVKCWGNNLFGQLGDGSTTTRFVPTDVSGLTSGVTALAAGGGHTCALTSGGAVKCWGYNFNGQLGDNSTTLRTVPTDVSGLASGATGIAAGIFHTCAWTSVGAAKCWGNNVYGQLGDNSTTQRNVPADVSGLTSGVAALATGGIYHSCALMNTGAVKCWGRNSHGQLGDNSTTQRNVPTDVSDLTAGLMLIAAGAEHTCALTNTGQAKCWGSNSYGQLGSSGVPTGLDILDVLGLSGIHRVEMVFGM